ncbi:single-stranded DNA-binding protein [Mycobacteroides abscessus subsp. abscessus]|uniref:single-stranded DNA-binding protein n=1 Tax=Mycobacteroides abscessus TaxID=36809 RepID=UPI00092B5603|nr:single-stranded DNA-binding protein [Mycobacteroides abscessus]UVK63464.1 ssDNA binding protein [Mycobacterium phage Baudelaire]WKW86584.1 ssDNA binding protein [Mycobacterium phage Aegeus]SIL73128.1 single-stranded DNA-binding protein [Mycobacteroides abscessus subsp. abscessus]
MPDTYVHIVGNLTADPEIRALPSGVTVANFTVASTPRRFDKQSGEWVDEETVFLRVNAWRAYAEGAADLLRKGDTVGVWGKLKQKSYETKDGDKRTSYEVEAEHVGAATVIKKKRESDPWGGAAKDDAPF